MALVLAAGLLSTPLHASRDASLPVGDGEPLLVHPGGDLSLRIRWEARVHEQGGEFLLLRGTEPGLLQPVVRVEASWNQTFEFVDLVAAPGPRVYELRYLDSRGVEHVLAVRAVRVAAVDAGDDVAPGAGPEIVRGLLAAWSGPDPAVFSWRRPTAAGGPPERPVEPPTPPPRRT